MIWGSWVSREVAGADTRPGWGPSGAERRGRPPGSKPTGCSQLLLGGTRLPHLIARASEPSGRGPWLPPHSSPLNSRQTGPSPTHGAWLSSWDPGLKQLPTCLPLWPHCPRSRPQTQCWVCRTPSSPHLLQVLPLETDGTQLPTLAPRSPLPDPLPPASPCSPSSCPRPSGSPWVAGPSTLGVSGHL